MGYTQSTETELARVCDANSNLPVVFVKMCDAPSMAAKSAMANHRHGTVVSWLPGHDVPSGLVSAIISRLGSSSNGGGDENRGGERPSPTKRIQALSAGSMSRSMSTRAKPPSLVTGPSLMDRLESPPSKMVADDLGVSGPLGGRVEMRARKGIRLGPSTNSDCVPESAPVDPAVAGEAAVDHAPQQHLLQAVQ